MREKNIFYNKKFLPIFLTQFLGAFNDNVFKNAIVILITFTAFSAAGLDDKQMVALCGGLFILPFFLFSSIAGEVADKFSKSNLVIWIKIWEVIVMIFGAIGFYYLNIPMLLVTLFFMGLQSTFFGPVKYSILPELLQENDLVKGNAYFEFGTFIAILIGTIVGGVLVTNNDNPQLHIGIAVVVFAILGVITSRKVVYLKASSPKTKVRANILKSTIDIVKLVKVDRDILWTVYLISWFWFLGAAFLSIIPSFSKDFLGGTKELVTFFLALFSIGIGVGSIICERLSHRRLNIGLVILGGIGITFFLFDMWMVSNIFAQLGESHGLTVKKMFTSFNSIRLVVDMFLFSMSGGIFTVPLYTLLQKRTASTVRSRIIAGNNIINSFFIVVSAIFLIILFNINLAVGEVFLVLALINASIIIISIKFMPELLLRFCCWLASGATSVSTSNKVMLNTKKVVILHSEFHRFNWILFFKIIDKKIKVLLPQKKYSILIERILKICGVIFYDTLDSVFNKAFHNEICKSKTQYIALFVDKENSNDIDKDLLMNSLRDSFGISIKLLSVKFESVAKKIIFNKSKKHIQINFFENNN